MNIYRWLLGHARQGSDIVDGEAATHGEEHWRLKRCDCVPIPFVASTNCVHTDSDHKRGPYHSLPTGCLGLIALI